MTAERIFDNSDGHFATGFDNSSHQHKCIVGIDYLLSINLSMQKAVTDVWISEVHELSSIT
jgi:hypothetical protein